MVTSKQNLHNWNVSIDEARVIQEKLQSRVVLKAPNLPIKTIAACDVSFDKHAPWLFAGVALFRYPQLELLEESVVRAPVTFPYVPGYLSFRETPAVLKAFEKISKLPDCIIVDGHGLAHPRFFGFACH